MKALKERLQQLQEKQAEREKDLRSGNIRIERQDERSADQRTAEKRATKK
jgi:hypothetical protein